MAPPAGKSRLTLGCNNKENQPNVRASTPSGTIAALDLSHISAISGSNMTRNIGHTSSDDDVLSAEVEYLSTALQNQIIFKQQMEKIEEMNKQIREMGEKVEEEKNKISAQMNSLKELAAVKQRYQVEKEMEEMTSRIDENVMEQLNKLITSFDAERNKLELKNISPLSDDKFKELFTELEGSVKTFKDGSNIDSLEKLATFLPSLEETFEKCHQVNKKCKDVTNSIERMILHRKTLTTIQNAAATKNSA